MPYSRSQYSILDLANKRGSVRLRNIVQRAQNTGTLPFSTVGDYLAAGEIADGMLLRVLGMGRACLNELKHLISCPPPWACQPCLFDDETVGTIDFNVSTDHDLAAFRNLNDLLQVLKPKHREVLTRYFGLADGNEMTLEEIGICCGLTRERIRQIKLEAIAILRKIFQAAVQARLISQTDLLWGTVTNGRKAIKPGKLPEANRQLMPQDRLFIEIGFGSMDHWLAAVAHKCDLGWILKDVDPAYFQAAYDWFHLAARNIKFPRHLTDLIELLPDTTNPSKLVTAIGFSGTHMHYGGYVICRPGTKRPRRAVRLHVLLCDCVPRKSMMLTALTDAYRELFPDDQCTGRDLQIVMSSAPHLFLNVYEEGWVAIGCGSHISELPTSVADCSSDEICGEEQTESSLAQSDQSTASSCLYALLKEQGPMYFDAIRDQFLEITGNRYSVASVGPLLIMGDSFVRLAPGIYGLTSHLEQPDVLKQAEYLLREQRQCKIYCHACWADEATNLYRLWTPSAEYQMVTWAKKEGLKELYGSLLAIAEPRLWPISDDENHRWQHRKMQHGFFHLEEFNQFPLTATLPSMADVTGAALVARSHGGISWLSANRSIGTRVDDRHAHSILALLVALRVVQAPGHWQQRHVFRGESMMLVDRMVEVLHRSERRFWTNEGISLLLSKWSIPLELGWVDPGELALLVDELSRLCPKKTNSTLELVTPMPPLDDLSNLDRLVELVRRKKAETHAFGLANAK